MKKVLIPLNVKNLNGRIYTKESFKKFDTDFFPIELIPSGQNVHGDVRLEYIKGLIKDMRIENDEFVGDVHILKLPMMEDILNGLDNGSIVVRPKSEAQVDENGIVSECVIKGFQFIRKEDDSFAGLV